LPHPYGGHPKKTAANPSRRKDDPAVVWPLPAKTTPAIPAPNPLSINPIVLYFNVFIPDSFAIAPGFMQTDMTKPMFENDGPLSFVLDLVPMKRVGLPHELGGTVILLASEASSFITGTVMSVDGGYTIV
jgi:Enoyl-(Acyl carrier protein) reductase